MISAKTSAESAEGEGETAPDEGESAEGEGESADSESDATLSTPTLLLTGVDLVSDEVTFIGTGTPGSQIEVLVDGEIVGKSQIEDDGNWALIIELDQQGEVEVQVLMITNDDVAAVSERVFLNLATSATQIDLPFLISPSPITTGEVTFGGIGYPGTLAQLVIDREAVGQTQIDQDGIWSLTTQLDQPGEIEVQVQIIDAEGQLVVATEPITVTVTAASGQ